MEENYSSDRDYKSIKPMEVHIKCLYDMIKALTRACYINDAETAISMSLPEIRCNLYKTDVENDLLPFDYNQFDMVTCFKCREHIKHPSNIIMEINAL